MVRPGIQRTGRLVGALAAACAVTAASSAEGQFLVRSNTPLTDSSFGQVLASTSANGLTDVVVAAPAANGARGLAGVFTLDASGVVSSATLQPVDLLANERFGFSVAISSSCIAAGSPFGTGARGKVRVYERLASGLGQPVLLESADPALNDAFGHAVAAHGDWLAVGEPLDDAGGTATDRGAVHLFRRSGGTWIAHARIVAPESIAGDTFGYTLTMDDSTLVIASRYADVGAMQQAGVVWTVALGADGSVGATTRVEAPDAAPYEWFGASVAIDGDTLVVGACRDTINAQASEQGTARVFRRTQAGWLQQAMLVSPGASTQDRFGNSVAIDGGSILVGADGQDPQGVSLAGMLHLFRSDTDGWVHDRAFELPNPGVNQNLGIACALHGTMVIGGAPRHTPPSGVLREGAVGAWLLPPACTGDVDGDGTIGGTDLGLLLTQWDAAGSADLDGNGIVDAADLGALLAGWGPCGP